MRMRQFTANRPRDDRAYSLETPPLVGGANRTDLCAVRCGRRAAGASARPLAGFAGAYRRGRR